MRFTLLSAALALLPTIGIQATDELTVTNQSTTSSFSLENVKKLTFADGNLQVVTYDETSAFPLSLNTKITFTNSTTGIGKAVATGNAGKIHYDGQQLSYDGLTDGDAMLFNASGQCLRRVARWNGTPISTEGLPSGLYIFKVNNQSVKFVKQ